MSNTTHKTSVAFAAINRYVEENVPKPVERKYAGSGYVRWGADNRYPDFLLSLYESSATLRSVIDGCVDYIVGDDVLFQGDASKALNSLGDIPRDIVRVTSHNLERAGGFAYQVIRSNDGDVAEVYPIDIRFIRTNEEVNVFWYSEKWGRGSNIKIIEYPAFMPDIKEKWATMSPEERKRHASSIFYYRQDRTHVYPTPCYVASIKGCVIERNVDDFHLNSLENGFAASAVINFLNGIPTDEDKDQIEQEINEKFSGHSNAARIMLNFADSKDNAATIEEFKVEDFGDRFAALEKSSRQKIFTAFRAVPALFGINPENNGFSATEYAEAFKLFNRTQIQPAQQTIIAAFEKIYGAPVLDIVPFSLGDEDTSATLAASLGVGGTQALVSIIESQALTIDQKMGALQVIFDLTKEQAALMLGSQAAAIPSETTIQSE